MTVLLDTDITYPLANNSSESSDYRTKEIQFGDGYKQSVLDGINYEKEEWPLGFKRQSLAASIILRDLLRNSKNGTANVLSWTPPGELTAKYWTATNVKRRPLTGAWWQVTCTLTREFIL